MFTGTLYPTQIPAAEKLCNKKRAILAWEQGTGKTVIAIAAASKLFSLSKATSALVVVPTSIVWQWETKVKELSEHPVVWSEATKKRTREYERVSKEQTEPFFYIVPYSLFKRDFAKISRIKWDIVVYDEAQEFKNNKTVTAKKVKELNLLQDPPYRWALTGTLIATKLEELYCIFHGVDKTFLPPWPKFEKLHIVRGELGGIHSYKNLQPLNKYLQQRMDRKTHADMAGQMPKLVEVVHKIEPTKEYLDAEKRLLACLDDLVDNISFDDEGNPQIPNSPEARKAYHEASQQLVGETKLKAAKKLIYEILAENPFNRIVVFCKWKSPLYELGKEFVWDGTFFTGDQSMVQRKHNVGMFASGQRRILFASNAGSTGLDLPYANYLIHLDVSPSHVLDDQRNKRITRLSSVHPTSVAYYLVVEHSLENFILYIVKQRGLLAKAVQEGTADEVVVRPISLRNYLRGEDD